MARLPALMEYRCPSTPGTMADFGATSSALWEEMDVVTRAPPAREVHSRSPLSASKACCAAGTVRANREKERELQFLGTQARSGVGAWHGRKSSSEGIDSLGNRTPDLSRAPFPASRSGGGSLVLLLSLSLSLCEETLTTLPSTVSTRTDSCMGCGGSVALPPPS